MKIIVRLNGTDKNPYLDLGLKQNPFPQIAMAEYAPHLLHLAMLGAEPIPNANHIVEHLKGWSPEFVQLCINKYKKGEMVEFSVEFPE